MERRIVAAFVGVILAVPSAWSLGYVSLPGPPASMILLTTAFAAPTAFCLAYVLTPPRPPKTAVVACIWMGLCLLLLLPMARRDACGVHALRRGSELRELILLGAEELERTGEVPPSFAVIAMRKQYFKPWLERLCGCESPADVRIGNYTLEEVMRGGVLENGLMAESLNARSGEIEALGRIRVWHNTRAWHAGAVVAWRDQDGCGGYDVPQFVSSDGQTFPVLAAGEHSMTPFIQQAKRLGIEYPAELLRMVERGPR
ncbi:MAG: hypothetical protein ACKVZJ_04955 [Phycisphaerales bacterium]